MMRVMKGVRSLSCRLRLQMKHTEATSAFAKEEIGCAGDTSIHGLKLSDAISALGPNTMKTIKSGSNAKVTLGRWHTGTCAEVLKKEVPGYDSK